MVLKQAFSTFSIALVLMLAVFQLQAKDVPPTPKTLVNDYAKMMSSSEAKKLEQKLVNYDNNTTTQISVVTIESLEGDDLFEYAQKLAGTWGIGGEKNNGVLLLISKKDKKIRIHTGYGTEGAVPDITANHIIENELTPAFKQGNYYAGIDNATNAIMQALAGEYNTKRAKKKEGSYIPFIIAMIVFLLLSVFGRKRRYQYSRGGSYASGPIWFGGLGGGSSGGSGFGGGGGGFGGFGGGSFGGGGASGGW